MRIDPKAVRKHMTAYCAVALIIIGLVLYGTRWCDTDPFPYFDVDGTQLGTAQVRPLVRTSEHARLSLFDTSFAMQIRRTNECQPRRCRR